MNPPRTMEPPLASPSPSPALAPRLSIVIPMYNEEGNLPALFQRLFAVCDALAGTWEVVCVDDGSRDGTARLVRDWQTRRRELALIRFARNFGQHAAVTAGFAHARGAWIITLDADLQNPPEEIPNLVQRFAAGHDLVNTVRRGRQDTWFRRWASKRTNALVRRISGIGLNDFGCMLRGYSREVAQAVVACRESRTFIPALASLHARRPVEIEVGHAARGAGASKYPLAKLLALQMDLIASFSVHPLKVLFAVGVVMGLIGCALGVALILGRLVWGAAWANDGTLTLLGILLFFTGGQFLAFGILGEYIGRIFQAVRLREPYLVQSIERVGEDTGEVHG